MSQVSVANHSDGLLTDLLLLPLLCRAFPHYTYAAIRPYYNERKEHD